MKLVVSTIIACIAIANALPMELGFDGRNAQDMIPKNARAKIRKIQNSAMKKAMSNLKQQAADANIDVDVDKLASAVGKSIPKQQLKEKFNQFMRNSKSMANSKKVQDANRNKNAFLGQGKAILNQNQGKNVGDFVKMFEGFLGEQIKNSGLNGEIKKAVEQAAEKGLEILEDKIPNKDMTLGQAKQTLYKQANGAVRKNGIPTNEAALKKMAQGQFNRVLNQVEQRIQG